MAQVFNAGDAGLAESFQDESTGAAAIIPATKADGKIDSSFIGGYKLKLKANDNFDVSSNPKSIFVNSDGFIEFSDRGATGKRESHGFLVESVSGIVDPSSTTEETFNTTGTTISRSVTIQSGSDKLILVAIGFASDNAQTQAGDITSVTYGGDNLTRKTKFFADADSFVDYWYLALGNLPTNRTDTLTINGLQSTGTDGKNAMVAYDVTGINQINPILGHDGTQTFSDNPNDIIEVKIGSPVFGVGACHGRVNGLDNDLNIDYQVLRGDGTRIMYFYSGISTQNSGSKLYNSDAEANPRTLSTAYISLEPEFDIREVDVIVAGTVSGFSGLEAGKVYYIGDDGEIINNPASVKEQVGLSISADSIYIKRIKQ